MAIRPLAPFTGYSVDVNIVMQTSEGVNPNTLVEKLLIFQSSGVGHMIKPKGPLAVLNASRPSGSV